MEYLLIAATVLIIAFFVLALISRAIYMAILRSLTSQALIMYKMADEAWQAKHGDDLERAQQKAMGIFNQEGR